jgi:hypothetical protein
MADDIDSFLQSQKDAAPAQPVAQPVAKALPASPSISSADPIDSFLQNQKAQDDANVTQQAQAVAIQNSQQSASTAAAAAPIARQLNAPQSAIETDVPRFQAQALAQTNAKVLSDNPAVAGWVAKNPDAARIAQNELPSLAALSPKDLDKQGDIGSFGTAGDYSLDVLRAMGRGAKDLGNSFNQLINWGLKGVGADQLSQIFEQHVVQPGLNISNQLALDPNASFGDKAADMLGNMTQMLSTAILTGPEQVAAGAAKLGTVAQEVGAQVVHGARTMLVPSISAAINAAQVDYEQHHDLGQAIRVGSATFGTTELGGIAPLAAEGSLPSRALQSFVSGATTGEVSRQAMNMVNPQVSPFDTQQLILNGIGAAVLGAGHGGPVHEGLVDTAVNGLKAEQAQQGAEQIARVSEFAQNSELKKADPAAFKSAIEAVLPGQQVYFDAKTFADALAQSPVDMSSVLGFHQKLDEAIQTGGDIGMPVSDFATHIAGTEVENSIMPTMKTSEDGMTVSEAEAALKPGNEEQAARAQDIAQRQQQREAENNQVDAIGANLAEQMKATGRYSNDVTNASLTPVQEFYRTQAARAGITPEEMYARYPLKITGELGGSDALDQSVLSPEHKAVETEAYNQISTNPDKLVKNYFKRNGNIIDPDKVKEMFPAFAKDPSLANAVHEPSSMLSKILFSKALKDNDGKPVTFTAGGGGSGKSEAMDVARDTFGLSKDNLVMDSTLSNFDSAKKRIDQARASGAPVDILYTNRPADKAFQFAMGRDRVVPLETLAAAHVGASDTIRQLAEHYKDDPGVEIRIVNNQGELSQMHVGKLEDVPKYDYNKVKGDLYDLANKAKENGDIDDAKYQAITTRAGSGGGAGEIQGKTQGQDLESTGGRTGSDSQEKTLSQENRGGFNPDTHTVGLFKHADLTTFLHESGHFYLHVLNDMANRDGAPQQFKDDMDTLQQFMGTPGDTPQARNDNWNAMSLDEQRAGHEKFATAFESYLMEGKAPTQKLQSLFSRFRSWLLSVYQSVAPGSFTSEVSQVMDRMLASDQAISETEKLRGYFPLDLSRSGATDDQLHDYISLGKQATDEAVAQLQAKSMRDMQWASNARSRVIKGLQERSKVMRRGEEIAASKEVMKEPVYQAWQFLSVGGDEAGQVLPGEKAPKSNPNQVDPTQDNLYKAIAKNGGLNADEVASKWGLKRADIGDSGVFGKPIVRKEGGLSIDRMAEKLVEQNYLSEHDLGEFEEKFNDQQNGNDQFSWQKDFTRNEKPYLDPVDLKEKYHGKLSTSDVKAMYGEDSREFKTLSERRMTSDTVGLDPDMLAETMGFPSGRDMIKSLLESESPYEAIKQLTDQRMLEKHGELVDRKAIEDAANAAVANEARARFMASGLKLLTDSKVSETQLTKAAKELADNIIKAKQAGEINPRQYEIAEAKANKEAVRQVIKDPRAAAQSQRQALLSNSLARSSREALDDIRRILANQAQYDKATIRGKMDPDVLEQMDALRERFDFRKNPTQGMTKKEIQLKNWNDSQIAAGYSPVQNVDMENSAVRMPWRQMTMEQLRGFHDTMKSLETIARQRKTITMGDKKMDLGDVVNEITAKMQERPDRFTTEELIHPKQLGVDPLMDVALSRIGATLRGYAAELKPQQYKANHFDNQQILGPFTRYIFNRVFDANYNKVSMLKGISNDFKSAVVDKLGKDWQQSLNELVPNNKLVDWDLTSSPENLTGGQIYRRITRGEMLGIARHVGNEANFDKLTKGMEWHGEDVWSFLHDNMTEKDWQSRVIEADAVSKHWQEELAMNRRLGNVDPEPVEPRPFSTKFGEMPGWYAPIDYDPINSRLAKARESKLAINPNDGSFGSSYFRADTTANGSLNTRKANYYDRLDLDYHAVERRIHDTIHDLAYREALLDANKIVNHPDFRSQFMHSYGPENYKSIQRWIGDLANGQNTDANLSKVSRVMGATRRMMVANGIGLRLSTMIKHGGSALAKSAGYFSGGGEKYFAARALAIATNHEAEVASARAKFPEIDARAMQQDRDYRELTASMFEPESLHSRAERFGHSGVAFLDLMSAVPTAHAAYDRAVTEGIPRNRGGTGKPMNHEDAVAYANQLVREAHGSNIESARSMLLNEKSEAVKMMTTLYGFMNNTLGQNMDLLSKAKTAGFSKPELFSRYIMAILVPSFVAGAVAGKDKGEDWAHWVGKSIAGEVTGLDPFVRNIASMLEGHSSAGQPAYMTAAGTVTKPVEDIVKAAKGKPVKAPIKDLSNAIGLGIPGMGQLGTSAQYLADVHFGKEQPKGVVDLARGIALGQSNKK